MTQKKAQGSSNKTATGTDKKSRSLDSITLDSFFPKVQRASTETVLTEEQQALLPQAEACFTNSFNRVRVLTVAAEKHVRRGVAPTDIDEHDGLYMDDRGYDDFVASTAAIAELVVLSQMAVFLGLPKETVDRVVEQNFNNMLNRTPEKRKP
jgi:hypothetical protein